MRLAGARSLASAALVATSFLAHAVPGDLDPTFYGGLDNGQFVDLVYQNVLGRAPEPGGRAFWTGQLNSGSMTRGEVMRGFSESNEYRGLIASEVYVTLIYMGMMRRAPDGGGFSHWVSYLDGGNSGLALISEFLGSSEYRARVAP